MVFSSAVFLFVFLPAVLLLYFLPLCFWDRRLEDHRKNLVLCGASLIFYAWGEPVYIILMLLSIGFNFNVGLDIERNESDPKVKKRIITAAVIFDLMLLGFFKYSNFIIGNINHIPSVNIPLLNVSLPVGISFYTFQILSYIIDVYRGEVKAQRNIISFAMYIAMFPQLIAGPIVQYSDIEKQLFGRSHTPEKFLDGVMVFIRGLGKKVIFANTIGAMHTEILTGGSEDLSAASAWLAAICYTMQIYFDFGGYSDMAIGLGRMFGFEFMQNFNFPYTAVSIKDFWKRWHISLSGWFRDYVYIPLGGSRKGTSRTILNLAIVWSLTGLWHGAAWNFIAWGAFYGLLLILEKYALSEIIPQIPVWVRHITTMIIVIVGWVFFSSDSIGSAFDLLGSMFLLKGNVVADAQFVYYFRNCGFLLLVMSLSAFGAYSEMPKPRNKYLGTACSVGFYGVIMALCVVSLVSDTYNPFLYFRF